MHNSRPQTTPIGRLTVPHFLLQRMNYEGRDTNQTADTSQEFMNTMQCSILSGSMSIHTSRVVIHTKNVNPVDRAVGHTKSCH